MTDTKTNYTIITKITKVEEAKQRVHLEGAGEAETFTHTSLGWFVSFEGSYESLYFGDTKPQLTVGKSVKITFQEIDDAQPSPAPVQ